MPMKISESGTAGEEFRTMGTDASVSLSGSASGQAELVAGIKDIFERNEHRFSRFDPQSELSRLNASLGQEQAVSASMLSVLELSAQYHHRFPEYFDPRILEYLEAAGYDRDFRQLDFSGNTVTAPDGPIAGELEEDVMIDPVRGRVRLKRRIDLAGIVKGWTVDECSRYLLAKNRKDFIIEAGGDMFVSGQESPGRPWTVDVEGVGQQAVLRLEDEGIATSGISRRKWRRGKERYHHLVDPRSPQHFSHDLKSVTVVSDSTTEADVLAKVIFLMGREKGLAWASDNGIRCLILDYKNQTYVSPKIKENLA